MRHQKVNQKLAISRTIFVFGHPTAIFPSQMITTKHERFHHTINVRESSQQIEKFLNYQRRSIIHFVNMCNKWSRETVAGKTEIINRCFQRSSERNKFLLGCWATDLCMK